MAEWLDTVFKNFDFSILSAMHGLAEAGGSPLTALMHFISFFAHDGICMFLLGILLMLPRRTRKIGVCVFVAVCCGGLITNIILKGWVDRVRPYAGHLSETVREWWEFAGSARANESPSRSFPSGHTTSAAAAMVGLFLSTKKKYTWPVLFFPFLMGISRMYLMVHYPTDVIAGLISGTVGGVAAFFITKSLFLHLEKHRDRRFAAFCLDFAPLSYLKIGKKKEEDPRV